MTIWCDGSGSSDPHCIMVGSEYIIRSIKILEEEVGFAMTKKIPLNTSNSTKIHYLFIYFEQTIFIYTKRIGEGPSYASQWAIFKKINEFFNTSRLLLICKKS